MLCIIALLLLLTESKSPCKACSHLRKAFLPAQVLFHWKVWGPSQGNHASVMRKHAIPIQTLLSYGSLVLYNFLRLQGTVQLDITGSSVSVCHSQPGQLTSAQSSVAGNKFKLDLRLACTEQTN